MTEHLLEELEALVEIYKDLHFTEDVFRDKLNIYFNAEINLNDLNDVIIVKQELSFKISYFPPILMDLKFSDNGASLDLKLHCDWLDEELITKLSEKIKSNVSESPEAILWNCFQFIANDALAFLFDKSENDIRINIEALTRNDDLYDILEDYNKRMLKTVFNRSIIDCSVCMVPKRGAECIELEHCKDVFCLSCASDFYDSQIKTGILELKCLVCGGQVEYEEIRHVLKKEEFDRWDRLLFNQCLKFENISHPCPRCQMVVMTEDDDFGICPQCQFIFCVKCYRTYHGSSMCDDELKKMDEMTAREKSKLEKIKILSEARDFRRTKALAKADKLFVRKIAYVCPRCGYGYQKDGGCNHMCCAMCKVHFCYICSKIIDQMKPFNHFEVSSSCLRIER